MGFLEDSKSSRGLERGQFGYQRTCLLVGWCEHAAAWQRVQASGLLATAIFTRTIVRKPSGQGAADTRIQGPEFGERLGLKLKVYVV